MIKAKKDTLDTVKKPFISGVSLTMGLWWIVGLEILFSLITSLKSFIPLAGVASIVYTLLVIVVGYISLGLTTGKMFFIKQYKSNTSISYNDVKSTLLSQANRLIAPMLLIGLAIIISMLLLGFLVASVNPSVTNLLNNTHPNLLVVVINIVQIVLTPLTVFFAPFFALKNLSFKKSLGESVRFALSHPYFSLAIAGVSALRILLTLLVQNFLPGQAVILNIILFSLWSVYISTVVYEYWTKEN